MVLRVVRTIVVHGVRESCVYGDYQKSVPIKLASLLILAAIGALSAYAISFKFLTYAPDNPRAITVTKKASTGAQQAQV